MTDFGSAALLIALVIVPFTMLAAVLSKMKDFPELWETAQRGVVASFGLLSIASVALVYAFVTRDFQVRYVYEYSSSEMSLAYTIAAWWAGQAGSLLFWAWMLSLFGVVVLYQNRRQNRDLMPWVVFVMMGTLTFFIGLMVFFSDPFERLPVTPAEGQGLNPLLENMGMFFHPTTLYLGYVGFTVPFAFAIAALATGRLGDVWIRSTRRWTIFAWFFLGMGNLFGAQWAYVELGWGGYMGWDPVENASIMPWLTGTAYLHSVMIQQRRGMLKVWNMVLIILTFALSIFGTMLTRSGILSSVHSFGVSGIGPLFLAFLGLILVASVFLLIDRLPRLRSENELDSFVSRESSFLVNNLLLVGVAFAMFWGTTFPLVSEAVRGVKVTVGPPFYEGVIPPILLLLLILMGVCPLIGWRRATRENLVRNFVKPLVAATMLSVGLYALGVHDLAALAGYWALIFVTGAILLEFYRGMLSRHRSRGEDYLTALLHLVWGNKSRYGGYIVHIGIIIMGFGVIASMAYDTSVEGNLSPGQSLSINQYNVQFVNLSEYNTAGKRVVSANLAISENGRSVGNLVSEKYFHRQHENAVTEVGIRTTLAEDLYIILVGWADDGTATFKVLVNPLVVWIWIGGVVLLVGTVVAMWPDAREARRMQAYARRTEAAPVPVGVTG